MLARFSASKGVLQLTAQLRHVHFPIRHDGSDFSEELENDYFPRRSLAEVTGHDVEPATLYASLAEVA